MNCGKLIMMSSSASTGSSLTGSPLSTGGSELPEGSDGSPHAASARSMQSAKINARYFFIVYPPFLLWLISLIADLRIHNFCANSISYD